MKKIMTLLKSQLIAVVFSVFFSPSANAQKIELGSSHSLAVCSDGTTWSWGNNDYGQLGDNTTTQKNLPIQISGLTNIVSVAADSFLSVALRNDGTVWEWGEFDCLGIDTLIPFQKTGISNVIAISVGKHILALRNDSTVWGWGCNYSGELGNGTNTTSNIPVQAIGISGIKSIKAGFWHSLALKNDGTVWAWGRNAFGDLGNGTNTDSNSPIQVSSLTNVVAIAAGYYSLALKNDGTVWAWGYNVHGQLGNGTNTNSNIPVQVSSLTNVIAVVAGFSHSLALKHDGTVWAWGNNDYGQLGNGTNTSSNTPIQVNSLTNITVVTAGGGYLGFGTGHSMAIKNDSTIWAWGCNFSGQLGDNSSANQNIPVLVPLSCKVDPNPNYMISAIEDFAKEKFEVKIYPNPFTDNTSINYSLEKNSVVNVELYNIIGAKVAAVLNHQNQSSGNHQLNLNSKQFNLNEGIYLVKLSIDGKVTTKKVLMVR